MSLVHQGLARMFVPVVSGAYHPQIYSPWGGPDTVPHRPPALDFHLESTRQIDHLHHHHQNQQPRSHRDDELAIVVPAVWLVKGKEVVSVMYQAPWEPQTCLIPMVNVSSGRASWATKDQIYTPRFSFSFLVSPTDPCETQSPLSIADAVHQTPLMFQMTELLVTQNHR